VEGEKHMKREVKLGILAFLLVLSSMPIIWFFVAYYPDAKFFIDGFLAGQGGIFMNPSRDWFDISSTLIMEDYRFSFTFIIVLIASTLVFLHTLIFMVRELYRFLSRRRKQTK
jgi:hypothetical protein